MLRRESILKLPGGMALFLGLKGRKVYHGVRKIYNGGRKVYHGVRKIYHGVRKVYHGVRKIYPGVRKVYHGVRKVYHGPVLVNPESFMEASRSAGALATQSYKCNKISPPHCSGKSLFHPGISFNKGTFY